MMSEPLSIEVKQPGKRAAFWITLARSILAAALGLALILRWGASGEGARRASVVAGIVGIVAGTLVLARFFLVDVLGEPVVAVILGMLIVLIGLVHVFEGFRTGVDWQRQRSWTSTLLGIFEIGLRVVVLTWRDEFGPVCYRVGFPRRVRAAARGAAEEGRDAPTKNWRDSKRKGAITCWNVRWSMP